MRKFIAIMVLLFGAASIDAVAEHHPEVTEPHGNWCAEDGTIIQQAEESFVLSGEPVDVQIVGTDGIDGIYFDGKLLKSCATASADADEPTKWCPDAPHDGLEDAVLVISDKIATINGTEINPGLVRFATLEGVIDGKPHNERIAIYRGRVFWPCKKSE